MAARARGLAVARGEERIVENGAAVAQLGRLGRGHRDVLGLASRSQIDHRDGVIEAGQHVHALPIDPLVQHQAAGASAAHGEVVGARTGGIEARPVGVEIRDRNDSDLARAEGRQIERRAVG